jgi:Zn-dependent M16 (insulinase) family peptidase
MREKFIIILTALVLCFSITFAQTNSPFESLRQGEKINGFTVANLYDNATGKAIGARFISDKYSFVIDLFYIQSVPQAFFWVKTIPETDRGEPHTLEHLVLGKGIRGRTTRALEDMSLASSSALTFSLSTSYTFYTLAGEDTFYKIFEAKLMSFVQPDFTDEEIRREVCHIGVVTDPTTGELALDEKGSVYTEMVSSFEKPNRYYYSAIQEMVYGDDHPVANSAGGVPASIRTMTAQDLRNFHKTYYHLGNMGAIITIPDNIALKPFLSQMGAILDRCQSYPEINARVGIDNFDLPMPKPMAPAGTIKIVDCPGNPKQDRGTMVFSWPADLDCDPYEEFIMDLFWGAFSGDAPSNLYNYFINSSTRKIDIGGSYINGYSGSRPGYPISIYFGGIDNSNITEFMIDSVRGLIMGEIKRFYDWPDGSDSLATFNDRIRNQLVQLKRNSEELLNRPPQFGTRALYMSPWYAQLQSLERIPGFRKSMIDKSRTDFADSLLNTSDNFWRKYIDHWKLLTVRPYAIGGRINDTILENERERKTERLAGYIETFKDRYGVSDGQLAITKYKEEFDKNTAILDSLSKLVPVPDFIGNPPMTLDDQLHYETIQLPGDIPLVSSTFDNMTSGTIGISLRMDVVPESLFVYLPFLPDVLTNIGVIKDGKTIPYEEMKELWRKEITGLGANYDIGYLKERVELQLVGAGGNPEELKKAIDWMQAALYSPYISKDNLPRILDVLDQQLISLRNVMKGSEETWVDDPSTAYQYQTNPLIMAAGCFLTQTHYIQRLRWLLTDPGDDSEQRQLVSILDNLASVGQGIDGQVLDSILAALENGTDSVSSIAKTISNASAQTKSTIDLIIKNLRMTIADIPDASLPGDWSYLCNRAKTDLLVKPEIALAQINDLLKLICHVDNARMFMISSTSTRNAVMDKIREFSGKLDTQSKSTRQQYVRNENIIDRLKERETGFNRPYFIGLINNNTNNGVIMSTVQLTGSYDTSSSAIIDQLAARMLSGSGAHGLFMKTWAAGLAYSNGPSISDRSGRIRYYAERCPDITETNKFVVNQVKTTELTPNLLNYAMAQIFRNSMAFGTYEARGQAIANDLADGFTPDMVRAYRQKVMAMLKDKSLFEKATARVEAVYGLPLVGLGSSQKDVSGGIYFILGPEEQFKLLENYIKSVEEPQPVYRLYPRDYWLLN